MKSGREQRLKAVYDMLREYIEDFEAAPSTHEAYPIEKALHIMREFYKSAEKKLLKQVLKKNG